MNPNPKPPKVENVFFIQRAAIDVLLLNQATAIEICIYLVISKYADRHGYYSGVGYKTIKERLGIGQKKAEAAIKRLTEMEYAGQRLLYSFDEWIFKETGNLPASENSGWVRGWLNSQYMYQVWLSNDLVGCNGDHIKPLNYFARHSAYDNHAQMLMLLYKYNNRDYAGVNYNIASIKTKLESSQKINDYNFYKSQLGQYHISKNIFGELSASITEREAISILNDLQDSKFINVSISAIGNYEASDKKEEKKTKKHDMMYYIRLHDRRLKNAHHKIETRINSISRISKKQPTPENLEKLAYATDKLKELIETYNRIVESGVYRSSNQTEAYENFKLREEIRKKKKEEEKYNSYKLIIVPSPKGSFSIIRKKIPKLTIQPDLTNNVNKEPRSEESDIAANIPSKLLFSKLLYRLDYKSANKRALNQDCNLATTIEGLAKSRGLESASRNGKFYKSYWWFNPGISEIDLVGILTPTFLHNDMTPEKSDQIHHTISEMITGKECEIVQKEEIEPCTIAIGLDI